MTPMTKEQLKDYKEIDGVLEYRPPFYRIYFDRWVMSWADLVDGLVGVLSLGYIRLGLDFKLTCKQAKRNIKKRMKTDEEERRVRRSAF